MFRSEQSQLFLFRSEQEVVQILNNILFRICTTRTVLNKIVLFRSVQIYVSVENAANSRLKCLELNSTEQHLFRF